MTARQKACPNKDVLIWARGQNGFTIAAAAKKIAVSPERLQSWEEGGDQPTIIQLRKLARVYEFSFAVFYLPAAPEGYQPIKDFRRFVAAGGTDLSSELTMEIRRAYDRRELAIELRRDLEVEPPHFVLRVQDQETAERFAARVRTTLGVSIEEQRRWREPSVGFREWRTRIEQNGVLVFQAAGIDLEEMRGFSVGDGTLPIMVVNRADAYAARSFTMLHELTHVALRDEGLCNLRDDGPTNAALRRVERYCNAVAGSALVPATALLALVEVARHESLRWEPRELDPIARAFAVSRQVIVRRLLELDRTDQGHYDQAMDQLEVEFRSRPPRKPGFLLPPADFLSLAGKTYAGLVITAYRENKLGASELADVLGMRLRHLGVIEGSLSA